MLKYFLLYFLSCNAQADEWSFKPSVAFGVGFSASLIETNQSSVYGVIQGFSINYGGEEGGMRFLGIGTTISSTPEFLFIPGATCILDKYCFAPHFAHNYIGMGFTYSFGGPK